MPTDPLLSPTKMLDFPAAELQALIDAKGWRSLLPDQKVAAIYSYVKDDIRFGYNAADTLPASAVLADGYGQCNTKGTLLMALLRAVDIPCRLHGFTIDKGLQRGIVPEAVYWLAPQNIVHSWVEVSLGDRWINLEGFILDQPVLTALQAAFPKRDRLCAYGAGTDTLHAPDVAWRGADTYIQKTGINQDFGTFDDPDSFLAAHPQQISGLSGVLYRGVIRHWMNHRVANMRKGRVPVIPGGPKRLDPA